MARRYQETESSLVRDNLQKFLQKASCPDCSGSRLKLPYRNVFIGDNNLPNLTDMSIEGSYEYLKNLTLEGKQGEIAEKILKEIIARLEFFGRWTKLSDAQSKRRDTFWRRSSEDQAR